MDPLAEVISLLGTQSVLSARAEMRGAWSLRFPPYEHVKFGGVLDGSLWIKSDGGVAAHLDAGDLYLLADGRSYVVATDLDIVPIDGRTLFRAQVGADGVVRHGSGSDRAMVMGGRFTFDAATCDLLLDALPPLLVVRRDAAGSEALAALLQLLIRETASTLPASELVLSSLARLVLIEVLRTHVAEGGKVGWLAALAHPQVGAALRMMHEQPARSWKVENLASAVGLSRTVFAARFKEQVGTTPLDYLIRWRLTLAKAALRGRRDNLSKIAAEVGYMSVSAFSAAFTRAVGCSPGRYRTLQ